MHCRGHVELNKLQFFVKISFARKIAADADSGIDRDGIYFSTCIVKDAPEFLDPLVGAEIHLETVDLDVERFEIGQYSIDFVGVRGDEQIVAVFSEDTGKIVA